eukprot:TRINITY_DN2651_c0_g1_i2.p1 TRINITY_DN2651_c0_g1~~TRINITY_DN2651_c0_g1_i2.p1  ORF type:complete len:614 (-),score=51.41 TRINITY_DN2651_c0_g1_i2:1424-3265(-)
MYRTQLFFSGPIQRVRHKYGCFTYPQKVRGRTSVSCLIKKNTTPVQREQLVVSCTNASSPETLPQTQQWTNVKVFIAKNIRSPYDGEILRILLPIVAANMLDPLMSLVDVGIIARLGIKPLAGVGMASSQVYFVGALLSFLSTLSTPPIAEHYINKDFQKLSKVVGKGMWIAICAGILLGAIVYLGAPAYLTNVIKLEQEVAVHALEYMQVRAIGMPMVTLAFVMAGTFRGCQDTFSPLLAEICAVIMNLGCDILFVFGFGWGVAGSAWATVLSYTVSNVWLFIVLLQQKGVQLRLLLAAPKIQEVINFMVQGAALSTRNLVTLGFVVVSGRATARLGYEATAANEIIRQIFSMFSMPQWSLNGATLSVVSKYLGAKQHMQARDVFIRCLTIGLCSAVTMGTLLFLFKYPIMYQFSSNQAVLSIASAGLSIVACFLWLDGMASVVEGGLSANMQTKELAIVAIYGMLLVIASLWILDANNLVKITIIWLLVRIISLMRVLFGWRKLFFNNPQYKAYEAFASINKSDNNDSNNNGKADSEVIQEHERDNDTDLTGKELAHDFKASSKSSGKDGSLYIKEIGKGSGAAAKEVISNVNGDKSKEETVFIADNTALA